MNEHERQTAEQNAHSLTVQKQALQQQHLEVELALKELAGSTNAYRIINNLLIQAPVAQLTEELEKKKETLATRLQTVEKQHERLKAKLQEQ
jgi:prefoldin beta subunit